MAPTAVTPSDLFPAVLRFLLDCGLTKSAQKFQKETCTEADQATSLPKLEEVYETWMSTKSKPAGETNGCAVDVSLSKAEKKRKKREAAEAAAAAEAEAAETIAPEKKKRKKSDAPVEEEGVAQAAVEPAVEKQKKKKKADVGEEGIVKVKGVPFKRVDDDAWRSKIEDSRLLDNTHKAKQKFGNEADGDTWGDKAAEDLGRVRGKDFRKEMMKKKKASWKGGGSIDQSTNSIAFPDSDDE